jgi:acyl carrier protein
MTEAELRKTVLDTLCDIAPEADLGALPPDKDLREELDIDSMDFLNFVIALHEKRGVDIPTPTIPRRELAGCTQVPA